MKLTPGMQQYMNEKQKYPDCILLFRMGDFYECFYEDAVLVSKLLGITLTNRGKGETRAPLAGIPYHSLERYLGKLVNSGNKVAICEQVENPKDAKGIVKREVVRVITPGTVVEDSILDQGSSNYLASIFIGEGFGLSFIELSTGHIDSCEVSSFEELKIELLKRRTAEIIVNSDDDSIKQLSLKENIYYQKVDPSFFWNASEVFKEQFNLTKEQAGFGDKDYAFLSIGGLLSYVRKNQKLHLQYLKKPLFYETTTFMKLDSFTIKNLELLKNIHDGTSRGTLLSVLDKTTTPMGSRLLKKWITQPLLQKELINERLLAVEELLSRPIEMQEIQNDLSTIFDVERLVSKICYKLQSPRDLLNLKDSLSMLPQIREKTKDFSSIISQLTQFPDVSHIVNSISSAIKDDIHENEIVRSGAGYGSGGLGKRAIGLIKRGFNKELDELYDLKIDTRKRIAELEQKEQEETGISLKIGYNKIFGYYIEVSNKFKDKVPPTYIRKQTLVNGERFITESLKNFEERLLTAEEKIITIEDTILKNIVTAIEKDISIIQDVSEKIATLDILSSFANHARENNYVKPEMHEGFHISIKDSRHPVIEQIETQFIPNDCFLSNKEFLMVITGPNMAGKSTYMRQVALTLILAQIGSFVPASSAEIGIVNQIFSRVGAYDDLTMGQSTFMVEMTETARILKHANEKSFIILDEIGRGTSTFDGVAIAWSVAEFILSRIKAKTLFATHYHVLTKLEEHKNRGIVNYNIAVAEHDNSIVFLRKIKRGGTDKSYGVHVAKIAGLPKEVIDTAILIQEQLESDAKIPEKIVFQTKKAFIDKNQKTLDF